MLGTLCCCSETRAILTRLVYNIITCFLIYLGISSESINITFHPSRQYLLFTFTCEFTRCNVSIQFLNEGYALNKQLIWSEFTFQKAF